MGRVSVVLDQDSIEKVNRLCDKLKLNFSAALRIIIQEYKK